ncbi:MAG: hypothetical protein PVG99_13065 [Desulfobacteraceae bacterium]
MKFRHAESVVSKYIGETEKNMDLISVEEKDADAILLFDETDAGVMARTDAQRGVGKAHRAAAFVTRAPSWRETTARQVEQRA